MNQFGNIGINNNNPSENYKLDISGSVICHNLALLNDFTLSANRSIRFRNTDCYLNVLNNQLQFNDSKAKLTLSDLTRLKSTTTTVFNRDDYLNIDLYKNNGEGEGNIDDFLEERGLTRLNIEEAELLNE